MKRHFKKIVMAFDVSTSNTGYAILIDGKPFQLPDGTLSIGSQKMQDMKTEKIPMAYDTYGDRMNASIKHIDKIRSIIYHMKGLNDYHMTEKKEGRTGITIDDFQVIFEVSEIPNFSRNVGQTLTTVRKLALYVGMTFALISSTIHNVLGMFMDQITYKIVQPTEWQKHIGFKTTSMTPKQERDKYGTSFAKYQSLQRANELLKRWNANPIEDDDMADAINIASVGLELRDSLNVKAMARAKGKRLTQLEVEANRTAKKISEYISKATLAKSKYMDIATWAFATPREGLTAVEKREQTKYSKISLKELIDKPAVEFLTPAELRQYKKFKEQEKETQARMVSMRSAKVHNA